MLENGGEKEEILKQKVCLKQNFSLFSKQHLAGLTPRGSFQTRSALLILSAEISHTSVAPCLDLLLLGGAFLCQAFVGLRATEVPWGPG